MSPNHRSTSAPSAFIAATLSMPREVEGQRAVAVRGEPGRERRVVRRGRGHGGGEQRTAPTAPLSAEPVGSNHVAASSRPSSAVRVRGCASYVVMTVVIEHETQTMTTVLESATLFLVTPDTRKRMIHGAARAIGTRGVGAMSLRDLAKEAGVPLGSTYHHFPGGKAQLAEEAVTSTGRQVAKLVEPRGSRASRARSPPSPGSGASCCVETDFRTGCPVLAVATGDDPELTETARGIFASWQDLMVAGARRRRRPGRAGARPGADDRRLARGRRRGEPRRALPGAARPGVRGADHPGAGGPCFASNHPCD